MATPTKNNYINNKDFLDALLAYKELCKVAKENDQPKPRIPNYIGECFLKIADGLGKRPNFFGYCVDEQTEALTKRGWLKYNEITTDDIILCVDPDTIDYSLKWSRVLDIYRDKEYNNICYSIKGRIDALVTPGHKWLTLNRGLVKIENLCSTDLVVIDTPTYYENDASVSCYFGDLDVSMVDYSGVVWCPTTEYGTFLARRNGIVYVTGNSFVDEMKSDAIENCLYHSDIIITEHGKKMIKEIVDTKYTGKVLSFNSNNQLEWNNVIGHSSVKNPNNKTRKSWVKVETYKTKEKKSKNLICTSDHLCATITKNGIEYVPAKDLVGKTLIRYSARNPDQYYTELVTKITEVRKRAESDLYDIQVANVNNFFANGVLVHNCLMYFENFDPEKSKNPFAYFTQISWFAFLRRIAAEKKQQYIKYKATESFGSLDESELIELGNGEVKQLEVYDNLYEFISQYESDMVKKKVVTEKSKGVELFIDDAIEEIIEELHLEDEE